MKVAAPIAALLLAFSGAAHALDAPRPEGWTEASRSNESVVFFKEHEATEARDILAYAEFDASPEAAFKVVTDFDAYPAFFPYVKESKLFKKTSASDLVVYQWMDVPLQPHRDYLLHFTLTKGNKGNGETFRSQWTAEPELAPEKEGYVRMKLYQGSWSFAPLDGGKRTRVTYMVLSHPGGGMPKWMVDQSVGTIPNIIKAVRERIKNPPKAVTATH